MKILFCGDAVVSTGFARCTHAACDALYAAGHEVAVLGINYFGDPHSYRYPIYPCRQPFDGGRDAMGGTRLPVLVERIKPDLIVLLNDPWNVDGYFHLLRDYGYKDDELPPVVGWLAVDGKNQMAEPLNRLAAVAAWTQFAADELRAGGYRGEPVVIPLGVDHATFFPRDQVEARRRVCAQNTPLDAFIVGAVGRNQPRKRLDLTLAYFADWVHGYDLTPEDAQLYLHVAPTGEAGVDIVSLARYYGLGNYVMLAQPNIGHGEPDTLMPYVYSALDVYLTTTQGEGWGLPALEAMACGIPCIVPDWSALGSVGGWTGDAVARVPCSTTAPTAPINGLCHTIGGIPDRAATVAELERMRTDEVRRARYRQAGLELAAGLSWADTGRQFVEFVELVMAERQAPAAATQEVAQ